MNTEDITKLKDENVNLRLALARKEQENRQLRRMLNKIGEYAVTVGKGPDNVNKTGSV